MAGVGALLDRVAGAIAASRTDGRPPAVLPSAILRDGVLGVEASVRLLPGLAEARGIKTDALRPPGAAVLLERWRFTVIRGDAEPAIQAWARWAISDPSRYCVATPICLIPEFAQFDREKSMLR